MYTSIYYWIIMLVYAQSNLIDLNLQRSITDCGFFVSSKLLIFNFAKYFGFSLCKVDPKRIF